MRFVLIRVLFAAALAALSASGARAQIPTSLTGSVTSSLTGLPVPGALIVFEAPSSNVQARTDDTGRFSVQVPAGEYHLSLRADGFKSSRVELTVGNEPLNQELTLDPDVHFSEVVSVSPDGRSQFDTYQPTAVLGGQELAKELQGTLGATIENLPGVALRSFGPGPARPVIRGLDGDRVLVLEDGQRMGDLSSQSGDHGVNVNPASASRLEVVRGPATLLYGANAIGGLVNVIKNDIPIAPVTRTSGSFTIDAGTAANEGGGAGDVTVGNGSVALHLSGSGRRAGDYQTALSQVPNSFSRAGFGQVGVSMTRENGFFGASYALDRTHYGVPFVEDGVTNLDPRRQILNFRGEKRSLGGFFEAVRGSFGVRRYRHDERDGEEIATQFTNNTTELELLAHHRPAGRLKGSIGGMLLTRAFKTEGAEALSPAVTQQNGAAFLYEEMTLTPHFAMQFGGRIEHARFNPEEGEPARSFTNGSASFGLLYRPSDATSVAVSLARAARNPALEELYFHGLHPGNYAFENGNSSLESEHALGLDLSFRWRLARASGEATYFINQINGFIYRQLTGRIEEDLPESFFMQGDARLQGVESHIDLTLTSLLSVEGGLDYVHAQLTALDVPLPRMPPLRGRVGLRVQKNAFQLGVDGVFTGEQARIFRVQTPEGEAGETATDGYQVLKLFSSYSFGSDRTVNTITVRLDNATNQLYRNHLNYLKDLTPEVGRSFRVVYSYKF